MRRAAPRPLRIFIYSAAEKADSAGVQGVVIGLAGYLRERGHEVVTAWPDGDAMRRDWRVHLEAGVGRSGKPTPRSSARAAFDFARLAGRLAQFRPDVVNLHYPRGQTIYFLALRRLLGFKLVLSYHGSDLHDASQTLRTRLPTWLPRADGLTAVSENMASKLAKLAPGADPVTITNGVDTSFWSPAREADREPGLMVAAGRLISLKGFDVLLSAMARPEAGASRLVLAGQGILEEELQQQIERLNLDDRVEMTGRLDKEQLRDRFRQASLFVMPSRREGMPLVLLEAMATGLPVIATHVGGIPRVMDEEVGELIAPDDPDALSAAIGARIANPALRAREAEGARKRAAHFSAEESFARYEQVFAQSVA